MADASVSLVQPTLALQERRALANAAVKHGRWMIRADNDGASPNKKAGGFHWPEPGEWIRAADFNTRKECGGGLHGQDRTWGGYGEGRRLVFCEWRGGYVGGIDGSKMKAEEARILLVGELPAGLICDGSLGLSGCDLKDIALPQAVGGSLYLSGRATAKVSPPQPRLRAKVIHALSWLFEGTGRHVSIDSGPARQPPGGDNNRGSCAVARCAPAHGRAMAPAPGLAQAG